MEAAGAVSKRRRSEYRLPALAQAQPAAERQSLPTAGQHGRPALARRVLLPQAGLETLGLELDHRVVEFERGTARLGA